MFLLSYGQIKGGWEWKALRPEVGGYHGLWIGGTIYLMNLPALLVALGFTPV